MNVSCTIILKINVTGDKEFVLNEIFLAQLSFKNLAGDELG